MIIVRPWEMNDFTGMNGGGTIMIEKHAISNSIAQVFDACFIDLIVK